jgi:hypothetical protein
MTAQTAAYDLLAMKPSGDEPDRSCLARAHQDRDHTNPLKVNSMYTLGAHFPTPKRRNYPCSHHPHSITL